MATETQTSKRLCGQMVSCLLHIIRGMSLSVVHISIKDSVNLCSPTDEVKKQFRAPVIFGAFKFFSEIIDTVHPGAKEETDHLVSVHS